MKIYSDILTVDDLANTIRQVPGMYIDQIESITRPKVRSRGWDIVTAGNTNRWKNSGTYGASRINSATWDDHGRWFMLLYAIDPNARIIRYNNVDDFHRKTNHKYKPVA